MSRPNAVAPTRVAQANWPSAVVPSPVAQAEPPTAVLLSWVARELLPTATATETGFDLSDAERAMIEAALRDRNGFDIELAWLFSDPTVRGLARRLAEDNAVSNDVVISLRGEGSRPPLFCVHPAGGLAWFYGGLAPHLRDRPIYGLQDPHVATGEPSVTDARVLARRYVEEIAAQGQHPGLAGERAGAGGSYVGPA